MGLPREKFREFVYFLICEKYFVYNISKYVVNAY